MPKLSTNGTERRRLQNGIVCLPRRRLTMMPVYSEACRAIAEAKSVDEVKDIRDKAVAMQAYAKQAKNRNLEAYAVAIRMRATRQLFALMTAQKQTIGLAKGGDKGGRQGKAGLRKNPANAPPSLAEAGIDKNLAHQARTLGKLSDERFREAVVDARDAVTRAVRTVVRAAEIDQSREGYGSRIETGCTVDDLVALSDSGEHFGVIYVDAPWTFRTYSKKGKQRSSERHYDVMTIEEIAALPVASLAAPDCALLLWCISPQLPGALEVIEAWGFDFKTIAFGWIKTTPSAQSVALDGDGLHWGMGYHTRANIELCLLATRGSPKRLAKHVHQVVIAPVGEHSVKPEEVRRRIERLYPGPRLELFARRPVDDWTVWGNEIASIP